MSTLYPIIRRVRRALLPPEEKAPGTALTVCGPSSPQPSDSVAPAPSALPGDDQSLLTSAAMGKKATPHPGPLPDRGGEGGDNQSLLTSAATKGRKGKREAAKSRVKAADEAHSTQP